MSYYDQSLDNAQLAGGAWEKLSQVAVKGAEYDSPERQPHPKCLKGTRVDFLAHIYGLLDDSESRLIWIHGTAGVGKSAAAFSVAERMRCLTTTEQRSGEKRLAGTFFFSRKYTNRCTTGYFFATLAYQLASKFPSIKADVTMTIRENPALLDPQKSLRDQMEALFLRPLRRLQPRLQECPPLVFVVDALDECTSENDIVDLISLLGQALHERDLPVIHVLFTSRPEAHICEAMNEEENVRPLVHKIPAETSAQGVTSLISLNGTDVDSDIYIFLEHSFTSLRRRCPTFPQPTEHELALLASRAGRRFIVASTMINFIKDGHSDPRDSCDQLNPRDQLTLMLRLTSKLLPGTEVFKFYDKILLTCADPERAYLHLSVVAALVNPLSMSQISELLEPREGRDVEEVLVQLRSVIDIPTDSNLPVNIYHSSVRDYALDPSNCSFFRKQCTVPHPHTLLVSSSLHLMIERIPASTSLLETLLKLKTQSQAMESQAPEMLKDSLAFTTELLTPLKVFMALLWLRDRSSVLYPWLETLNGHAWLQTEVGNDWLNNQGRLDWLQTQAGWAWLRTGHGKVWLQTPDVQAWLKNLNELPWLETESGRNWLPTFYGRQWLETRIGQEWLQTERGTVWLQTRSAQIWLEERGGSAWLKTESRYEWLRNSCGRIWLGTRSGEEWLGTESVQEWLETGNARVWLESWNGRNWLGGSGGQRWLKTECGQGWLETWSGHIWLESGSGQAWLRNWSGREWTQTKSGQEWLQTKEGMIWLQSETGQRWLQTKSAQGWLRTNEGMVWLQGGNGQRWLQTKSAPEWLQTKSGQQWCETWSGRQWLHDESMREWLQTRRGREWLHTESGGQWLRSWDARVWLQTESAKLWLQTKIAQEWLATEVAWEWLKTEVAQDWLGTEAAREWLRTEVAQDWLRTKIAQDQLKIGDFTHGRLTTAATQLEDMPRTEVVRDTPLQPQIESGKESLKARDGTERLKTYTGIYLISKDGRKEVTSEGRGARKWLKTEVAREWLKTNDGRKWLKGDEVPLMWWQKTGNARERLTNDGRVRLLRRHEWLETDGREWLNTDDGREWQKSHDGRVWLREGDTWLSTKVGRMWLQDEDGREWLKSEDGRVWLRGGNGWLNTEAGRVRLQIKNERRYNKDGRKWLNTGDGREWLKSDDGREWLKSDDGREWPNTEDGREWLQSEDGEQWLQITDGREWLQTAHGQAWQSTPAGFFQVHMEDFLGTVEAAREFIVISEFSSLPAFRIIQEFNSLPDFLMFPAFLALSPKCLNTTSLVPRHGGPAMEIIHVVEAFVDTANEVHERSRSVSDAVMSYACQNWAAHLSRTPAPWDNTLNHIFNMFLGEYLLPWFERQWCLHGLRSCLDVLSEMQKFAKDIFKGRNSDL